MALLYFVQISRSRSPQLSPCHSKNIQAWCPIVVSVYFPILSSKDDISFRHELGSAHVKFDPLNQKSNLVVWVDLNRY